MITLSQQEDFVRQNLVKLGEWIELPSLVDHGLAIMKDTALRHGLERSVAPVDFFRTKSWDGTARFGLYRITQYSLVRALGARKAIETGVLHGLSSAFLLQGLADNRGGRLYSIDYPSTFESGPSNDDGFKDTLPPKLGSGWAIPESLRGFWTLNLGRSVDLMPAIANDGNPTDVFVHDSEHTWETMTFEFECIWPKLAPGGVIVADNIDCNTSFFDFARSVRRIPYIAPVDPDHFTPGGSGIRFGVLRK